MTAEATRHRSLPQAVPAPIREIAGLRALFRYRVGWRTFFLPHDLIPDAMELTAWVALHDTGDRSLASPDNGGATIVLDDIPSQSGVALALNAFGGPWSASRSIVGVRRLVKGTLQASGLDDAQAGSLAPNVNFRHRDVAADAQHHRVLDGFLRRKPLEAAAAMSQHAKRAIVRRPETVLLRLEA